MHPIKAFFFSPHPYIFFNHDHHSMTFFGFRLNDHGDLLGIGSERILEERLINATLKEQLKAQGVDFNIKDEKRLVSHTGVYLIYLSQLCIFTNQKCSYRISMLVSFTTFLHLLENTIIARPFLHFSLDFII